MCCWCGSGIRRRRYIRFSNLEFKHLPQLYYVLLCYYCVDCVWHNEKDECELKGHFACMP
eukprot:COSAG05_NODE_788_length_7333_cov_14.016727_2_plen_60_part_00